MDITQVWEGLIKGGKGKIIYVIMDGVGGLPNPDRGGTELQVAKTPHLDDLARKSSCGLLEMVGPGITPGSGPGHFALFGYDPLEYKLGRGILSALGIDFCLQEGDVAARINFATIDRQGNVADRRAGRIDSQTNRHLCSKIRDNVCTNKDMKIFLETVSEHRAVLVLRGPGLGGNLADTDPQQTGVPPDNPRALSGDSEGTARAIASFVEQAKEILSDEGRANMVLFRGFDRYAPFPSLAKRFGLKAVCVAEYPMYRGISRLLGMDVLPAPEGPEESFDSLRDAYDREYDFYFLHLKKTDSTGEDGDFDRKVRAIEAIDGLMPLVTGLNPEVLVVTGDHSTPATMAGHSWHPVPVMISSKYSRADTVESFDETSCLRGALGTRPGVHLIGLALAHSGRLKKYGA